MGQGVRTQGETTQRERQTMNYMILGLCVGVWVVCGVVSYRTMRRWWRAQGHVWTKGDRRIAVVFAVFAAPAHLLAARALLSEDRKSCIDEETDHE